MRNTSPSRSLLGGLQKPVDDGDTWLISLTDIISFLLGFFVLMAASSVIDRNKYAEMSASISQMVGKSQRVVNPQNSVPVMDYTDVLQAVEGFISEQNLKQFVSVTLTQRGVELTANDKLMFASGSANLNAVAGTFLTRIATLIQTLPYRIQVEGHTDDLPIKSPLYPSNWELSSARASSVVRLLIAQGVTPRRLTAVGYAATRPVIAYSKRSELAAARAKNRRVVLVLTKQSADSPYSG